MTREELLEKRRAGFEGWFERLNYYTPCRTFTGSSYYYSDKRIADAWDTWNAALDSVVIELPSAFEDEYGHLVIDKDDAIDSIEQQGYKVKP